MAHRKCSFCAPPPRNSTSRSTLLALLPVCQPSFSSLRVFYVAAFFSSNKPPLHLPTGPHAAQVAQCDTQCFNSPDPNSPFKSLTRGHHPLGLNGTADHCRLTEVEELQPLKADCNQVQVEDRTRNQSETLIIQAVFNLDLNFSDAHDKKITTEHSHNTPWCTSAVGPSAGRSMAQSVHCDGTRLTAVSHTTRFRARPHDGVGSVATRRSRPRRPQRHSLHLELVA
jgi:hypothetical protein